MEVHCEGDKCFLRKKEEGPAGAAKDVSAAAQVSVDVVEISTETVTLEMHCDNSAEFNLQWRNEDKMVEDAADGWEDVGGKDRLLGNGVKKKGMTPGGKFTFRARAKLPDGSFTEFSAPVSVQAPSEPLGVPPTVQSIVAQEGEEKRFVATVGWERVAGAEKYEVQIRTLRSGVEPVWRTLSAALSAPIVRKKNLSPASDYIFRARAYHGGKWGEWTGASAPAQAGGLSPAFSKLFGDTLIRRNPATNSIQKVSTANELSGKVVCLYMSAGWCPPCVQQSKMMKQPDMYPAWKQKGLPVEIVFVSADRDQSGFDNYFGQMPWLALPFSQRCQEIMSMYKVEGIPRLMIFSPSGKLISNNAAGVPLSEQTVRSWMGHA